MHSDVIGLYLSGKDSASNLSKTTQVYFYIYRERETWLLLKGFEHESFPLKFIAIVFKYKIHSVEIDLHLHTHFCVIPEGFEAKFFPLKYNPMTSECQIYSAEVDLQYYFK